MTTLEASIQYCYSVETIEKLARAGRIKARKVGKEWDIDRFSIEAYRLSGPKRGRPRKPVTTLKVTMALEGEAAGMKWKRRFSSSRAKTYTLWVEHNGSWQIFHNVAVSISPPNFVQSLVPTQSQGF